MTTDHAVDSPGGDMDKACYRKLKPYKYKLTADHRYPTGIVPEAACGNRFVLLSATGLLTMRDGYAWDGASGPTLDTASFLRGALVHDALYQLMREGLLDPKWRDPADRLLQKICLEDGMYRLRAAYVYHTVRLFGAANARPRPAAAPVIHCLPETDG